MDLSDALGAAEEPHERGVSPQSVGPPDLHWPLSAPKWPCGQPSVLGGTERRQRLGSTSGAVVNGRPWLLVLIQVRAALDHLRLLGGALNPGPVVEVRSNCRTETVLGLKRLGKCLNSPHRHHPEPDGRDHAYEAFQWCRKARGKVGSMATPRLI